jgi:hypothetical protein
MTTCIRFTLAALILVAAGTSSSPARDAAGCPDISRNKLPERSKTDGTPGGIFLSLQDDEETPLLDSPSAFATQSAATASLHPSCPGTGAIETGDCYSSLRIIRIAPKQGPPIGLPRV